jgi:ferredoxin-NADP reductase
MMEANTLSLRVTEIEQLSPTLRRLVLEPADGGLLPVASAGAHISLSLESADGALIRNSYSLVSGHGAGDRYELIVRRVARSRGGSRHVHERLAVGSVVEATVPHNLFPLLSHARKHLLIGGGIGVTPLLSFLPVLRADKARLELHQIATLDEAPLFEALLGAHAGDDVHVHAGRDALDITALLARQPLGTHVYVCGPAELMDRVEAMAAELGWPPSSVHREDFGASGGAPFVVRLAGNGREIAVGAGQTMLAALEAAGVPAPSLCRGGVCGECLTRVIEGMPEHRDHFLTDEEKASGALVMPCVSRAKTGMLVLDF